jgi:L-ribulose-5-phosphate 3-epimerase
MRLGYNTNGLAHHDLLDALRLLADLGYRSVAITIDHGSLNPFDDRLRKQLERVRDELQRLQLHSVIETGARFLLDARHKHEPTLMSVAADARRRRIEFLCRAIDIAAELQSDCVSCWSGIAVDQPSPEVGRQRLVAALRPVLEYAESQTMPLGFEPEPGMFVATLADYEQLLRELDSPQLQLTLDVGHLHCQGEVPIASHIRRWGSRLVNVHIEDMRRDVHEHLMFGEGEMDFPPIVRALAECGYAGGVHVELSRHSHEGPTAARRAYEFLMPLWPDPSAAQRP